MAFKGYPISSLKQKWSDGIKSKSLTDPRRNQRTPFLEPSVQPAYEALLNAAQRQSGLRDAVLGGTADIHSVVRILRIPPVHHHLRAVYSGE